MSKHAILSPSSAFRWMLCPGSAKAQQNYPDEQSIPAMNGSIQHNVAETCLTENHDPLSFVDQTLTLEDEDGAVIHEMVFTVEHAQTVQTYVDYVKSFEGDLLVETAVDFSRFVPEGRGTADAIVVRDGEIVIVDLKTGHALILAEGNSQLMLYALGAYLMYSFLYDIKTIRMCICQPTRDHFDEWEITADELVNWAYNEAKPAALLAMSDNAPRVPGESQCKWCKARVDCPAFRKFSLSTLGEDFAEALDKPVLKNPNGLSLTQLSKVLEHTKMIENFLEACNERARILIEAGAQVPGWKMVEGRSVRKWSDEDVAEKALSRKLKVAERFKKTLISPAQAEKLLGRGHPLIEDLAIKSKGNPQLVPATDKRPAIEYSTVEDDFKDSDSNAA